MPELPDVEICKQYVDATSLHQTIEKVQVYEGRILEDISVKKLKAELEGHAFDATHRHGKYLFISLDKGNWLVLHFGMTGYLKYFKKDNKEPPHDRMLIDFSNGYHLAYDSQRILGEVKLIEDVEKFITGKELGPDVLEQAFDIEAFKAVLSERRAMVKSALMNQKIMAGIGNVYSDEILFQAKMHPKITVDDLDNDDLEKLYRTMRKVLQVVIERRADPDRFPDSYITPRRQSGERCPRCGAEIAQVKVAGRTSYYCPNCQKER